MSEKIYATGSIAGISLTDTSGEDCAVRLIEPENLLLGLVVTGEEALDGSFHSQVFTTDTADFAVSIPALPKTKFDQIIAAIKAAVLAHTYFMVVLQDDWTTISRKVTIRSEKGWVKIGRGDGLTREAYVEGIEFKFVTLAP
jgi:hypothetical protein